MPSLPARPRARPTGSSAASATSRSAASRFRSASSTRAGVYRAEIYRDGDTADYRTNAHDIVIESKLVRSSDRLSLRMAPGGGFAIRFVPTPRD